MNKLVPKKVIDTQNIPTSTEGRDIYEAIQWHFSEKLNIPFKSVEAKKQASLFLDRAGIDGMQVPSGTVYKKYRGSENYIFFNDKNITIESVQRIRKE